MKQLTLDLYERIIKTFYEQTRKNLQLLGHVTEQECAEYIAFYAYHKGLFWRERDGKITAVATGHPSKKHFDWKWEPLSDTWTTHCIWASHDSDLKDLLKEFLNEYVVRNFYACRRGELVHLNHRKLERILNYGRRKQRRRFSTPASTTVQRIDAVNSASADRPSTSGVPEGGRVSAQVPSLAGADSGSSSQGSACSVHAATA
jgi:hypothetical protein